MARLGVNAGAAALRTDCAAAACATACSDVLAPIASSSGLRAVAAVPATVLLPRQAGCSKAPFMLPQPAAPSASLKPGGISPVLVGDGPLLLARVDPGKTFRGKQQQ